MNIQTSISTTHWRQFDDRDAYQALIADNLAAELTDLDSATWW